MVNFAEAYKSGLNSANLAKKNQEEIKSVFSELNSQILAATERKIFVWITQLPDQQDPETEEFLSLGPRFWETNPLPDLLKTDQNQKFHWAIAAENIKVPKIESTMMASDPKSITKRKLADGIIAELARWTPNPAGYPCQINTGSKIIYCENKSGLERALVEMLGDPRVGKKLQKLQNLPISEQANIAAPADMIDSDASNRTESEE